MGLDAAQVLSSGVTQWAIKTIRDDIIADLEMLDLDGSPEAERKKDLLICELKVCKRFLGKFQMRIRQGKVQEDKEARRERQG